MACTHIYVTEFYSFLLTIEGSIELRIISICNTHVINKRISVQTSDACCLYIQGKDTWYREGLGKSVECRPPSDLPWSYVGNDEPNLQQEVIELEKKETEHNQ